MGLWVLMAKNGDVPQKVGDLASELDADPMLLGMFSGNQPFQTSVRR
jgi:hypothetical protein